MATDKKGRKGYTRGPAQQAKCVLVGGLVELGALAEARVGGDRLLRALLAGLLLAVGVWLTGCQSYISLYTIYM